jgi:hypothetical protein
VTINILSLGWVLNSVDPPPGAEEGGQIGILDKASLTTNCMPTDLQCDYCKRCKTQNVIQHRTSLGAEPIFMFFVHFPKVKKL